MEDRSHQQHSKILTFIVRTFFYSLYLLIQGLIFVGESTKKILLSPVKISLFLTHSFTNLSTKAARSLKYTFSLLVQKLKKNHTPIHPEKLHPQAQKANHTPVSVPVFAQKETKKVKTNQPNPLSTFLKEKINSISFPKIKPQFSVLAKIILIFQIIAIAIQKPVSHLLSIVKNIFKTPFKVVTFAFNGSFKYFFIGFFFCLLIIGAHQSYIFVQSLPSPQSIGKVNYPLSTYLYDRNGKLLYEIYRDQNRTPIKLKDMPKYVYQASIAIEDKDFYKHNGVSVFSGVLRAFKDTVLSHNVQGGSTITQQLIKTSLLSPERTITRKLKEMVLAMWAERIYTKDQILEMYLNQVSYGGSSYGIEEASKIYFNKNANELSIAEAALLAGLPQAPSVYSPYVNPAFAIKRRNDVLHKLKEQGYITEKQRQEAEAENPTIVPLTNNLKAPHFVFYVKNQLEEEYGVQQVEEGGLRVTTTLDLGIQDEVEKILHEELDKIKNLNVTNGAILVTRPETGEILAMVGSVDYYAQPSGAFNVTTASRQPGSSIKPLLYSMALERGYTAGTLIDDTPTVFNIPGTTPYKPVNYDGKFHGRIPIRYALANSFNIPAVRLINTYGVDKFVSHAKKMGISTWDDSSRFGLSLSLGGGEVRMVDMSEAFGVFANQGNRVDLTGINKIQNADKDVIQDLSPRKYKIMDEGITYIISDILSDNIARQWEFGPHSFLEIPGYKVAAKTGTTEDKHDNWTIGYTPEFVVTVWVGNNDNTPMNPYLSSGITGAAPIWNRVMTYLLQNKSDKKPEHVWFAKPDNVVQKSCNFGRPEMFIKGTENSVPCAVAITPTPKP